MQTPLGPECSYGNKGYAMCSNPVCRKPGIICESGYLKKDECGLFHESCDKIKWAELEKMVYDNTNLSSPDFIYLREKI